MRALGACPFLSYLTPCTAYHVFVQAIVRACVAHVAVPTVVPTHLPLCLRPDPGVRVLLFGMWVSQHTSAPVPYLLHIHAVALTQHGKFQDQAYTGQQL